MPPEIVIKIIIAIIIIMLVFAKYIYGHHSHHCLLSSVIPEECRPTKAKVGMVIQEPDINIIDSYTLYIFLLL